jgi:hypothetical protein
MYPKVAAGGAALPFTGLVLGWKAVAAASLGAGWRRDRAVATEAQVGRLTWQP